MAKSITRRTLVGYSEASINAHYFDDLINTLKYKKNSFIERIQTGNYWKKGQKNMKFDAVVGNPPYQITSDKTSDTPVYNLFMDAAFEISPKVTFITPARFLFDAGKTPKEWNKKVLNDKHFQVIYYTANSNDVFPNVDIKGGVAITLRNIDSDGNPIIKFSPFKEISSLLLKVSPCEEKSIATLCYQCSKFNLNELYKDFPKFQDIIGSGGRERRLTTKIFEQLTVFTDKKQDHQIGIVGLIKNNRVIKYVDAKYLSLDGNINSWKVLVPKSNGSGALGECLSTPMIGQPMIGHTQSFISFGSFSSRYQAESCMKYIKTKFARCLLGTLKVTQDNPRDTWINVPLQNFSEKSDINWDSSISELDQQLYKKYRLSEDEINFIESKVQSMS